MINKKNKSSLVAFLLTITSASFAQAPPDYSVACKEELAKLSYLAGHWKGEATVRQGQGAEIVISQEEKITYELDGTLLRIEGVGRDSYGNVVFNALGLVNYDAPNKKIKLLRDELEIEMTVGSRVVMVNGRTADRQLDQSVTLKDDRAYIPLRGTAELLGHDDYWYRGEVVIN